MKFQPGLLPRKATDRRFLAAPLAAVNVVPALVDLRPQLLSSSNQGNTPKCAAYSMAGWLEYYNWKYKGIAAQIDPDPIYDRAKMLDGVPEAAGTTLEAVLQAAHDLQLITPVETASIRFVGPDGVQQALHRYGVILAAFNIAEGWRGAAPNGWIAEGGVALGGHAVLLCGYSTVDNPPWYGIQNSWGEQQGWRGFNRMTVSLFKQQFDYGLICDFPERI
jgi:hypothetical protein